MICALWGAACQPAEMHSTTPPGPPPTPGPDAGTVDPGASPSGEPPAEEGCVHEGPPVLDPAMLRECPFCSGGRCVPGALVPEGERERLADCDGETKCVPDLFVRTGGHFLLPSCRSVGGAEGRCVSLCVPETAEKADYLPQSSCTETERCAPCFDPTTGEDTGVCRLSCDPGPSEAPAMFEPCCGGAGSCVPIDAVPAERRAELDSDVCTDGLLCAPTALTDPGYRPPTCRSVAGAEGRCLPTCLPHVAEQADFLPRDSCGDGELCAACYDPRTGEETGACTQNGDSPAEPPTELTRCCEHHHDYHGRCVPRELVPAERRDHLHENECHSEGDGLLCVPDVFLADPDYRPPPCRTEGLIGGGQPGACLPACVIGPAALFLSQSSCAEWEKCAPCTDPLSGEDTGACR